MLKDIDANMSIRLDVRVINLSRKGDYRCLEWIVHWELDLKEEDPSFVGRTFWSHHGSLPVVEVSIVAGAG